jgi:hypothetical protein
VPNDQSKIVVGLYFGKKDNLLPSYLYQIVSKADFNFIVKATLKYSIKNDKFKIHLYTDLTPLLNVTGLKQETKQRNIVFTPQDGFLFDWIYSIDPIIRPNRIKDIITKGIEECLDILKNGEKENIEVPAEPRYSPQFFVIPNNALHSSPLSFLQDNNLVPYLQQAVTTPMPTQSTENNSIAIEEPPEKPVKKPDVDLSKNNKNFLKGFTGTSFASMGKSNN